MKKVFLKQLDLINFKGHKHLCIDFKERTIVSGDNATGKSTIMDAFLWLLFGKDQFDRKDFEIIPFVNGKKIDRVDPSVEAALEVEGREMTMKRVLHQKWTRKRGTSEEVFDGTETLFYHNEVPLKAGEYKARVDLIVEETLFKQITNPAYFLNRNWQEQRSILFQVAGTVTDAQIAATKPEFAKLLDMLSGKSLAEFKKEVSARKKKLKADLDNIQPRIDQTSRLMPRERDFLVMETQLLSLEKHISDIDLQISDRAALIRAQYEGIQEKQDKINALKLKQSEIVNAAQEVENNSANEKAKVRQQIQHEITLAGQNIENLSAQKNTAERALETLKRQANIIFKEMGELRLDWEAENEKEYKPVSGCLVCPVFGTECNDSNALGKHEEAKQKAEIAFNDAKEKTLDKITEQGQQKRAELDLLEGRMNTGSEMISAINDKLIAARAEYEKKTRELTFCEVATPKRVNELTLPEWMELDKQIEAIKATIQQTPVAETGTLHEQKHDLNKQRDQVKKDLQDRELIAKHKKAIVELEEQGRDLAQQIADLEQQEFTCDAFNRVKIDELDRRVNSMFGVVKFQLYDRTNEGNEFECCIATNKAGVPIAATNTAERINAGLDIIRTLSGFYQVSAPVFCDGAESVNNYIETGSQMVFLKVTKEKALSIA